MLHDAYWFTFTQYFKVRVRNSLLRPAIRALPADVLVRSALVLGRVCALCVLQLPNATKEDETSALLDVQEAVFGRMAENFVALLLTVPLAHKDDFFEVRFAVFTVSPVCTEHRLPLDCPDTHLCVCWFGVCGFVVWSGAAIL